jgi:AraC-like DNA-binding protein
MRAVGAAQLIEVKGRAQRLELRQQSSEGFYLVAMQREGNGSMRQSGRTALLRPGDAAIYAGALPCQHDLHSDFRITMLMLPAAPLRLACPGIDGRTASTISGQLRMVHLLAVMADNHFNTPYEELPKQVAAHAEHALRDTVAACVAASGAMASSRSGLEQYHLSRIREYALANLGDTELSVASVAAALGFSAAHLHRLFSDEAQTFSNWLWEMRLEACHAALREPAHAGRAISEIAYSYGFSQAAHFSRAYRARFGTTASAWRKGHGTD